MARYFKYKSPEDVVRDAQRLGHSLGMSDDVSVLFEPVAVGRLTAGNRLAVQPMEGCDGTPDGRPDELTYRRYRRFGAGGAAMIWGEATAVVEDGRMNPRQLTINDQTASSLEDMLRTCRDAHAETFGSSQDLIVGLQLTHSGRYSFRKALPVMHDPTLDPRTVDKASGRTLDDSYPLLTDDELRRLEDHYVAAALLARRIGFDFVDIKQCHRYLLSELLAATTRPGPYGGSLENRTRFVRSVIGRLRDEAPDLTIATRMNSYDGIPYEKRETDDAGQPCPHDLPLSTVFGVNPDNHLEEQLDEPVAVAGMLAELGVAMINVSCGNPYANPHVVRPAEFAPVDGYQAPEHPLVGVLRHFRISRRIQAAVPNVPVVGSAYSWLQDYAMQAAAANIRDGHVQIVGKWTGPESNRRHQDFQSCALPTELPVGLDPP